MKTAQQSRRQHNIDGTGIRFKEVKYKARYKDLDNISKIEKYKNSQNSNYPKSINNTMWKNVHDSEKDSFDRSTCNFNKSTYT